MRKNPKTSYECLECGKELNLRRHSSICYGKKTFIIMGAGIVGFAVLMTIVIQLIDAGVLPQSMMSSGGKAWGLILMAVLGIALSLPKERRFNCPDCDWTQTTTLIPRKARFSSQSYIDKNRIIPKKRRKNVSKLIPVKTLDCPNCGSPVYGQQMKCDVCKIKLERKIKITKKVKRHLKWEEEELHEKKSVNKYKFIIWASYMLLAIPLLFIKREYFVFWLIIFFTSMVSLLVWVAIKSRFK